MSRVFASILALGLFLAPASGVRAEPEAFYGEYEFSMGENRTKFHARRYAAREAKRRALEQAAVWLASETEALNGVVVTDRVMSRVHAVASVAVVREEGRVRDGNNFSYFVRVKCVVDPDLLKAAMEESNRPKRDMFEVWADEYEAKKAVEKAAAHQAVQ